MAGETGLLEGGFAIGKRLRGKSEHTHGGNSNDQFFHFGYSVKEKSY